MGAITTFEEYKAAVDHGVRYNVLPRQAVNATGVTTSAISLWCEQFAGTTPTASVVCDSGTAGGLLTTPNLASTTAQKWIASVETVQGGSERGYLIYDRLVHQAGLVGNVATSQVTNLPTAALTRYTDGIGVCIVLTIYTAIGSTASDLVVTYTNQAGVGGRTSKPAACNTSLSPRLSIMVPLADGDTGVRSVESIILSASTGTAGNIGISLIKPLYLVPVTDGNRYESLYSLGLACGRMIEILPDACLCALLKTGSTSHGISGTMRLAEV